ncbi:MAG TPA: hypothetical protein VFZ61_07825, partial [Polyangiales bacterium]
MLVSRVSLAAAFMLVLGACSKEEKTESPCSRGQIEGCGLTCGPSASCNGGLYCGGDSTCTADCTLATVAMDCEDGASCSSDGRCVLESSTTDGGAGDAGDGGQGCGIVTLQADPVTPNVILIIDQSSSMDEEFGSSTRWQSLKDSLLSDTGLIKELQHVVRFGATFYSA